MYNNILFVDIIYKIMIGVRNVETFNTQQTIFKALT